MKSRALVHHMLGSYLEIDDDAIDDADRIAELGLSPLDIVFIVLELEDLDPGDGSFVLSALANAKTVGDLVTLVDQWLAHDTSPDLGADIADQGATIMDDGIDIDWDDDEEEEDGGPDMQPSKIRVLVADDDDAMRQLVASELIKEGYEVGEAVSGSDLLRALESIGADAWPLDGVDLIVLDLRMPGANGLEILHKLRAARWDTPAILMTGFAEPDVVAEATRLGAPVVSKPFALETLTVTASLLLAGSRDKSYDGARGGFGLRH